MHDSRGAALKVGDRVLIEAEITDLQPEADPNYCNVRVKAITPNQRDTTPMTPPSGMVFNTKMLTKVGFVIAIAFAMLFATPAFAVDKKVERERRIRVIAAAVLAGGSPATVADLGGCRTDISTAFNDAVKDNKPLVIFVMADCGGRGCGLDAGVIAVKLDSYTGDGAPDPKAERILVLSPSGDGKTLTFRKPLPADATIDQVKDAAKAAKPTIAETAPPLDWFGAADADGERTVPTVAEIAPCNELDEDLQPIQFRFSKAPPVCNGPECKAAAAAAAPLVATTDPRMLPPSSIPKPMPGPTQSWTAPSTSAGKGGFVCRLRDRAKHAVETIQSHRPRLVGRGGGCGCR